MEIEDAAIEYIAENIKTNIRALEGEARTYSGGSGFQEYDAH